MIKLNPKSHLIEGKKHCKTLKLIKLCYELWSFIGNEGQAAKQSQKQHKTLTLVYCNLFCLIKLLPSKLCQSLMHFTNVLHVQPSLPLFLSALRQRACASHFSLYVDLKWVGCNYDSFLHSIVFLPASFTILSPFACFI